MEHDIKIADIVVSVNGRDAGGRFVVIGLDGDYALLADGKGRRAEKPKRKKVRHIRFEAKLEGRVAEKLHGAERVQNSELRRALYADGVNAADGINAAGGEVKDAESGVLKEMEEVC